METVQGIDEIAANQVIAYIQEDVMSIDEMDAIQGVASIQKVATIEENLSVRHVLPPSTRVGMNDFCLYDIETADVNFEFTINGRTVFVPAHKCLFAHQSAVFRQMFFGKMKDEGDNITQVKMVDAMPEEFIEFAKCFYYQRTKITAINVRALTYLTHKYDVKVFENECKLFLNKMVELNTVSIFWVLPMSILFNYDNLQQKCVDLIHSNGRILMESLKFNNCSLETLKSVLNIRFDSRNEARVFEMCISWAKESCEQNELDPTSRENLRNQLGDCLALIRFDEMSSSQFVQCLSNHSYMFLSDEIGNIAQVVKGPEQKFATVVVPPVIRVDCINERFEPSLHDLMIDEGTADVFFTFGNSSGVKDKRITAHKCILSAYSSIFKSELMALNRSNTVPITDASFEAYATFIHIFYSYAKAELLKHHPDLSNENIEKVLMLVKKYNVCNGHTLDLIEDELMSIRDDKHLFWLFGLSRKHSLYFLHCLCIKRIETGTDIFASQKFLNLCWESFGTVFSLILSKCDASTACDAGVTWARAFCVRNHQIASGDNIRTALGHFWTMMPFADLEPVQFIRHRYELGDIFPARQIKTIIDKMANAYESDVSLNESEAVASEAENSESSCSTMESDDESSLSSIEYDTISEGELESLVENDTSK